MCTIFSGHISFGEEDWGKVYFGPTYVHHEIDRKSIPHEYLLAWETEKEADFSSFRFTHDCGYDVDGPTKQALMELLEEWGKEQEEHVHEYLEHIAMEDRDYDVREVAILYITNQEILAKIAMKDKDCQVRVITTKRITNQKALAKIATEDGHWLVRMEAIKHITDQEVLAKIATENEHWAVREAATSRITELNQK